MDVLIWFHAAIFACIVTPLDGWKVVGVRMCQEQCQNQRGCVAVAFDAAHLMCTLVSKYKDFRTDSKLHILKVLETEAALKDCHQNDRLVVNKKKQPICVSTTETVPAIGYVILVLHRSRNKLYHKLRVPSENVISIHVTFEYIRAILYLRNRNRIVVALRSKIISCSVTFRNKKHIRSIVISNLLSDEEEGHLFISFIKVVKVKVCRMTLKGRKLSEVLRVRSAFYFVMGIDTKNKRIFIYIGYEILSYTYGGVKSISEIPKGTKKVRALVFCCETNALYYAAGDTIMKTSESKTTTVVSSVPFFIFDMIILGNHLYVTGSRNNHMMIRIDLTGQHQKVITLAQNQSHMFSFAMIGVAQN